MKRLYVAILVVTLAACGSMVPPPDMQAHAEKYFAAMQSGNVDDALNLYGSDFYAVTPRDKWRRMLQRIGEKLGKMKSHKLAGWRTTSRIGTGSGTYLELNYDVVYEKYPAQELITVLRASKSDRPTIIAHNINSQGLVLE